MSGASREQKPLILRHLSRRLVIQGMLKPLAVLNQAINSQVIVELKGNREYRGVLDGYDPHMNVVLKNAEELINNEVVRKLPVTIVRGDNVIYISP